MKKWGVKRFHPLTGINFNRLEAVLQIMDSTCFHPLTGINFNASVLSCVTTEVVSIPSRG